MIRDAIGLAFAKAATGPIRELVEEALAARELARPADLQAARAQLAAIEARNGPSALREVTERLTRLERRLDTLSAKVDMTIGAIQAATSTLNAAQRDVKGALAVAERAAAEAAEAAAATTAAADRVVDGPSAPPVVVAVTAPVPGHACRVPGCTSDHRARGFCGRHYQQWRRNRLVGHVGPDGAVTLADGSTWRVERRLAGLPATLDGDTLHIGVLAPAHTTSSS